MENRMSTEADHWFKLCLLTASTCFAGYLTIVDVCRATNQGPGDTVRLVHTRCTLERHVTTRNGWEAILVRGCCRLLFYSGGSVDTAALLKERKIERVR